MSHLLVFSTSVLLLCIFYQDIKYRAVSWILFPGVAILLFALILLQLRGSNVFWYATGMLINFALITFQLAAIKIYFFFRSGVWQSFIDSKIGLGDVFMFYTIATYFSPLNFLTFLTICLSFSIVFALLKKLLSANTYIEKNVPLAGFIALILLIFMLLNLYFQFNTLEDWGYKI